MSYRRRPRDGLSRLWVFTLTALGSTEAEMKIIGCDLHAAQQTIAMLDRETGEIVEKTLKHEAGTVREFYAALAAPVDR